MRGAKRIVDGWQNILTKVGTSDDKATSAGFCFVKLTDAKARKLWRGDDIAARIVEKIPRAAFRRKFELKIGEEQSKELAEKVLAELEELKIRSWFVRAGSMERALGGCALYPVINDGQENLEEPLDENNIAKVQRFQLMEPRELDPIEYYDDPNDAKFGEPKIFRLRPIQPRRGKRATTEVKMHESRLIVFPGVRFSRDDDGMTPGWGDSVLQRVYDVLQDYEMGLKNGGTLLNEFSQGVLKLKGLYDMVASSQDDEVAARLRTLVMAKSVVRNLVIDGEDDYVQVPIDFTSVPDMVDRLEWRMSSAADMPRTIVMGQPPSGLNATGQSDLEVFNNTVEEIREDRYLDRLERAIQLVFLSKDGPTNGVEPKVWSAEFCPLKTPNELEAAQTSLTVAQRDQIYYDMGSYTARQIAEARSAGDTYSAALPQIEEGETDVELDPNSAEAATLRETEGGTAVGGAENIQATVLNGAQVTSMVDVVRAIAAREIPRTSGVAILQVAFQMSAAQAEAVAGPADFKPEPDAPPAGGSPFPPMKLPKAPPTEPDDEEDDDAEA